MVHQSLEAHQVLERAFYKEPALWDLVWYSKLSNNKIMKKVDRIHSSMLAFANESEEPFPICYQSFLVTLSRNLHDLPARLHKTSWQEWMYMLPAAEEIISRFGEATLMPLHGNSPASSIHDEEEDEDEDKDEAKDEDDEAPCSPSLVPPPTNTSSKSALKTRPPIDMKKPAGKGKAKAHEPALKVKPVSGPGHKLQGHVQLAEPITDIVSHASPPPTVLAEELTDTIDERETMPVTVETLLQHATMDIAIVRVLQVPTLLGRSGCIQCTAKCTACKHGDKIKTCPNCTKAGFCSCSLDAATLHEVKTQVFQEVYSCTPMIKFHEDCFEHANETLTMLTLLHQKALESRVAAFANIVVALSHIEENHGQDFKQQIEDTVQVKATKIEDAHQSSSVSSFDHLMEAPSMLPPQEEHEVLVDVPMSSEEVDNQETHSETSSPVKVDLMLKGTSASTSALLVLTYRKWSCASP
ncbi:hypothetical protein IW262DRAFT_1298058 [Armillaria fumosa]|nr:hypothetical protein IW262DRAFT_1298058 [Armillaria fumosa]